MNVTANRTGIFRIIWGLLALATFSSSAFVFADCSQISEQMREQVRERELLIARQFELQKQFDLHVKEDYDVQGLGRPSEIHRNAAVKARFDLKRVERQLSERDASLVELGKKYCEVCLPREDAVSAPVDYCRQCPAATLCSSK